MSHAPRTFDARRRRERARPDEELPLPLARSLARAGLPDDRRGARLQDGDGRGVGRRGEEPRRLDPVEGGRHPVRRRAALLRHQRLLHRGHRRVHAEEGGRRPGLLPAPPPPHLPALLGHLRDLAGPGVGGRAPGLRAALHRGGRSHPPPGRADAAPVAGQPDADGDVAIPPDRRRRGEPAPPSSGPRGRSATRSSSTRSAACSSGSPRGGSGRGSSSPAWGRWSRAPSRG